MAELTAETLNIERLKSKAGIEIFELGFKLFKHGRVDIQEVTPTAARFVVRDAPSQNVELRIANNYLYLKCACRYATRGLVCEHEMAAALALEEHLQVNRPPQWQAKLNRVLNAAPVQRRTRPAPYLLCFSLQTDFDSPYASWKIVPYQIPISVLPPELKLQEEIPVKDLREWIESNAGHLLRMLKSPYYGMNPEGCLNCQPDSIGLANVILERSRAYSYYFGNYPLEEYLNLVARSGVPVFLGSPQKPLEKQIQILTQPVEIRLDLTRQPDGLHLLALLAFPEVVEPLPGLREVESGLAASLPLKDIQPKIVIGSPLWLLADRYLFPVGNELNPDILDAFLDDPELIVAPEEEADFQEKFLLPLAQQTRLQGDAVTWETVEAGPAPRIYLSENKGELQVQLRLNYNGHEVVYEPRLPEESLLHGAEPWRLVRLLRQPEKEEAFYKSLSSSAYGLKRAPLAAQPGTFYLRTRVQPVDFLLHYVPRLARDGFEVFGEEKLKTARVNRNKPTLSFNISSGIDWFDVQAVVNFGEIEVSFKEIRRLLRKKQQYVKLADGTIGEIPNEWIERYKHLLALGEEDGENLRVSRHHLTLLDQLVQSADDAHTDQEFERRRQRLHGFSGITSHPLPAGFTGELRPYQKAGYDWLHFLHEYEFGGCLADDMGLGKTVQVLTFLQSLYEDRPADRAASLVVVPRSLLVNWQREATRFTPNLRILEYFNGSRQREVANFDEWDVIITTYGVMLRDVAKLRGYRFHHVILDESQAIKNPLAQTAKAARLLLSDHRLVLTGTPVENSSVELWSQFSFLNPGLLGSLDYFKSEFATPIEKKGDEQTAQFLRQLIFPFILRRTKDQVAPELPPRTERLLYSDLEPAQRKLYNRTRDYYRGMLMGMLEKEGLNNARMKILEGLLRLRQISNHPRLVDQKFRGDSGKFDLLTETLETLHSEGHKALIFSQFVQMLSLVREVLDERKIPYEYLDGKTQNRQERVDHFQEDDKVPFFLISLKAGGQGLNLTAADYVIHIDPWWNPAVEMQATDRTHRIGQDKPVFVYKLIARDTVEEKLLQLQERKKNLVQQIISTESNFFKNLTPEDVQVLFS